MRKFNVYPSAEEDTEKSFEACLPDAVLLSSSEGEYVIKTDVCDTWNSAEQTMNILREAGMPDSIMSIESSNLLLILDCPDVIVEEERRGVVITYNPFKFVMVSCE